MNRPPSDPAERPVPHEDPASWKAEASARLLATWNQVRIEGQDGSIRPDSSLPSTKPRTDSITAQEVQQEAPKNTQRDAQSTGPQSVDPQSIRPPPAELDSADLDSEESESGINSILDSQIDSRRDSTRATRRRRLVWMGSGSIVLHLLVLLALWLMPRENPPIDISESGQQVSMMFDSQSTSGRQGNPVPQSAPGEHQAEPTPGPSAPTPHATPSAQPSAPPPPPPPQVNLNPDEPDSDSAPPPIPMPPMEAPNEFVAPPPPRPRPPLPRPPRPVARPRPPSPNNPFSSPMNFSFNGHPAPPPPAHSGSRGINMGFSIPQASAPRGGSESTSESGGLDAHQVDGPALGRDWFAQLGEWWVHHRYYPEQAAMNGEDGPVGIRFVLDAQGQVRSVEVRSRSGSQWLDLGAISIFRGAKLPPFPPGLQGNLATVDLTISYHLIRR